MKNDRSTSNLGDSAKAAGSSSANVSVNVHVALQNLSKYTF